MKDINKLGIFIRSWEGGFVNDPADLGGITNKGITYSTYKIYCKKVGKTPSVAALKNITDAEWNAILKNFFWDKWKADNITNEWVAYLLVDFYWHSGANAVKRTQSAFGLQSDGVVGPKTLSTLNSMDGQECFKICWNARKNYLESICKSRPANAKFLKGWMNRLNSIQYGKLICSNKKVLV